MSRLKHGFKTSFTNAGIAEMVKKSKDGFPEFPAWMHKAIVDTFTNPKSKYFVSGWLK